MTRPMGVFKKSNDYAQKFPNFDATPKAVIAALAFSLAMRCSEDNEDEARKLLIDEWGILHNCGIVPQNPRTK